MKGYKAFDKGLICRGFQYEVGKTYKHNGKIGLCESGFHFCKTASDCAVHYDHAISEFAEIEAFGKIIEGDNKCVTDEIKIVRLISRLEFYELVNEGKNNVGVRNTGNSNTGDWNTGNSNTGYRNTGYRNTGNSNTGNSNTGYRNTGNYNTGYRNTGDWNTGDYNTGNRNTGNSNTGNRNTGNRNTGNSNTGYRNTGNYNTGYRNTGDWNTGDWNCTDRSTGLFCTEIQTVKIFDIDTGKTYEELSDLLPTILWDIPFGCYWSNDELKTYTSEDRQKFYDSLSDGDKSKIKAIPHFNAEKFKKCTGIKVED